MNEIRMCGKPFRGRFSRNQAIHMLAMDVRQETSRHGIRRLSPHTRNERFCGVAGFQRRKRYLGVDAVAGGVRRQHRVPENARDAARNDMSGAQIGLGEKREDRVVALATGKIDTANEAADDACGVGADAPVDSLAE
jgi:hypothetical protein